MENNVIALKGNNDHVLEINQTANEHTIISKTGLSYLRQLEPILKCEDVIFAHSLPFFKELGISCITRYMGELEIRRFFTMADHRILFRGHGHDPEIVWEQNNIIQRAYLKTGAKTDLEKHQPCIITCGDLTRGLAMIWDKRANVLKSLSFL